MRWGSGLFRGDVVGIVVGRLLPPDYPGLSVGISHIKTKKPGHCPGVVRWVGENLSVREVCQEYEQLPCSASRESMS